MTLLLMVLMVLMFLAGLVAGGALLPSLLRDLNYN